MSNLTQIGPKHFADTIKGYIKIGWSKVKIDREEKGFALTLPLTEYDHNVDDDVDYCYIVWKKKGKHYTQIAEFINKKDANDFFMKKVEPELCGCGLNFTETPCYFCDNLRTINFNKHYTFCPRCSVIYTTMKKIRRACPHIKDDTPEVLRFPWYNHMSHKFKVHLVVNEKLNTKRCSLCDATSETDGW